MLNQNTQASAANAGNLPGEFSFEGHAVRTIPDGERILFVAKDVAEILGYENTRKAISDHCKQAKSLKDLWGGNESLRPLPVAPPLDLQLKVIPESDVYRLIMRSGLDAAERFQDWVTNDVLPTIRKTGRYQTEQDAWPPKITGPNGEFLVPVPGPGQYIIIVQKAGNCFIKAATYDQITKEHNLLDAKLFA